MFKQTDPLPRGIRNNNPMNIRENQRSDFDWEGEHTLDLDSEFEEFITPTYGYRAAARIMISYSRRGIWTVEDIIGTWAPATENVVEDYITTVTDITGFDRKDTMTHGDYVQLFAAMTFHENGIQPYDSITISNGIGLALK